jgi:hypothetical protein
MEEKKGPCSDSTMTMVRDFNPDCSGQVKISSGGEEGKG